MHGSQSETYRLVPPNPAEYRRHKARRARFPDARDRNRNHSCHPTMARRLHRTCRIEMPFSAASRSMTTACNDERWSEPPRREAISSAFALRSPRPTLCRQACCGKRFPDQATEEVEIQIPKRQSQARASAPAGEPRADSNTQTNAPNGEAFRASPSDRHCRSVVPANACEGSGAECVLVILVAIHSSRRWRPVSWTKTSSRLAWRVLRCSS